MCGVTRIKILNGFDQFVDLFVLRIGLRGWFGVCSHRMQQAIFGIAQVIYPNLAISAGFQVHRDHGRPHLVDGARGIVFQPLAIRAGGSRGSRFHVATLALVNDDERNVVLREERDCITGGC